MNQNDILREIYMSEVINVDNELELLYTQHSSYFQTMAKMHEEAQESALVLSSDDIELLESQFDRFYFEYAFIQFKRGVQIGFLLNQG